MRFLPLWLIHAAAVAITLFVSAIMLAIVQYAMQWEFSNWIDLTLLGLAIGAVTSSLPGKRRVEQPLPPPRTA